MLNRLGAGGIAGLLVILGGIALIAYQSLIVAAGLGLILVGLGLVVKGLVGNVMRQFGMV